MILALIPARSGSKSIPNKNIKDYCGKPLIAWSIEQAKQSKYITDIIVSTDCEEIKKIAEKYGAEVPFLRPKKISGDHSTDYEFMKHATEWLEYRNRTPGMIVHLRPTYPNRNFNDIDKCIEKFRNEPSYTSIRSVVESEHSAYKMYTNKNQQLIPLFNTINGINEPYNNARQLLPKCYWHNGCIDITTPNCLKKFESVSGNKILMYEMKNDEVDDIDTIEEWNRSEKHYYTTLKPE